MSSDKEIPFDNHERFMKEKHEKINKMFEATSICMSSV